MILVLTSQSAHKQPQGARSAPPGTVARAVFLPGQRLLISRGPDLRNKNPNKNPVSVKSFLTFTARVNQSFSFHGWRVMSRTASFCCDASEMLMHVRCLGILLKRRLSASGRGPESLLFFSGFRGGVYAACLRTTLQATELSYRRRQGPADNPCSSGLPIAE